MRAIQDRVDAVIHNDPNVFMNFTMTGAGSFIGANQGLMFIFLKPRSERMPIEMEAGQLMGSLGTITGVIAFLQPLPVLEISTGATEQSQGQYAFSLSGVDPDEVYDVASKFMAKLMEYPGFSTVSSDYYSNTPNLDIECYEQRVLNFRNGIDDRPRAVVNRRYRNGRRKLGVHYRQQLFYAVRDFDGVRAGLSEHCNDDGRRRDRMALIQNLMSMRSSSTVSVTEATSRR